MYRTLLLHYWCRGPSQCTLLHFLLDVCMTVILLHRKEVLVIHRQLCVGWVGLLRYMFPLVCLWCYKITHFTWSWVYPSKDTLKRLVFHWCLLTDSCFQGVFWWSDSALVNMDSDGALRLQGGKQTTGFDSLFLETQILVHSGQLQEAEILQRKILHILELLQVSVFSFFWLLIEPTFWATKLIVVLNNVSNDSSWYYWLLQTICYVCWWIQAT